MDSTGLPGSRLPLSGLLSAWLGACLRGSASPDALIAALGDGDARHVVLGLDHEPVPLVLAIGVLRARGATSASLALPVSGDLCGLGGPADFNARALDAGQAVLVTGTGLGLVPVRAPHGVGWQSLPAQPPPPIDPTEAAAQLRQTLVEATARLVGLDVARWQPEVADVLSNVARRVPDPLPAGFEPREIDTVERAVLCLEVVALARSTDGGALSVAEIEARAAALAPLDRAARRALVAVLSR